MKCPRCKCTLPHDVTHCPKCFFKIAHPSINTTQPKSSETQIPVSTSKTNEDKQAVEQSPLTPKAETDNRSISRQKKSTHKPKVSPSPRVIEFDDDSNFEQHLNSILEDQEISVDFVKDATNKTKTKNPIDNEVFNLLFEFETEDDKSAETSDKNTAISDSVAKSAINRYVDVFLEEPKHETTSNIENSEIELQPFKTEDNITEKKPTEDTTLEQTDLQNFDLLQQLIKVISEDYGLDLNGVIALAKNRAKSRETIGVSLDAEHQSQLELLWQQVDADLIALPIETSIEANLVDVLNIKRNDKIDLLFDLVEQEILNPSMHNSTKQAAVKSENRIVENDQIKAAFQTFEQEEEFDRIEIQKEKNPLSEITSNGVVYEAPSLWSRICCASIDFLSYAVLVTVVILLRQDSRDAILNNTPIVELYRFMSIDIMFSLWIWTALTSFLTLGTGQSLGQKVMGLITISEDGGLPNIKSAAVRSIAISTSIISCGLGILPILFGKETWQDMIAKTRIVRV